MLIAAFCLSRNKKTTLFACRRSLVSMRHGIIKQMQAKNNFIKLIIIAVVEIRSFGMISKGAKSFLGQVSGHPNISKNYAHVCFSHLVWISLHVVTTVTFCFPDSMATHLFVSSHTKKLVFSLGVSGWGLRATRTTQSNNKATTKQQQSTTIMIIIYSHFFWIVKMRNYTHMFSLSLLRFACYIFQC